MHGFRVGWISGGRNRTEQNMPTKVTSILDVFYMNSASHRVDLFALNEFSVDEFGERRVWNKTSTTFRDMKLHKTHAHKYSAYIHMRWRGGAMGKALGLAISRSRVQVLLEATLRNNLRQVVYTYVPLSPSSITWYQPKGGDALRMGR